MKLHLHVLSAFMMLMAMAFTSNAKPNSPVNYIDYIPKYRSQNKNFILTKITYSSTKMVIFFSYVVGREEEVLSFGGAGSSQAWKIHTSVRNASDFSKYASLENIKINGDLKAKKIADHDEPQFVAKHGEVVTGEAHFTKLPSNIRSIHLSGGRLAVCNDILIKDSQSPMLGTEEQMKGNINRFYNMLSNFGVKVIRKEAVQPKTTPKVEKVAKAEPKTPKVLVEEAAQPIDYVPKELTTATDMECNTRVILKNVYFKDNSASYAGRVEALATIQIIVDYMNYYPKSIIVLHGHTDVHGSAIQNMNLSEKRALTVRNTLATKGIDGDRIKILHHGGEQPLPGYEAGNRKNRRVEVELLCKK